MSEMNLDSIVEAVHQATKHRDAKREAYGAQLETVIASALDAAKVSVVEVAGHRVARERITADCSQWSNRVDYPAHRGEALLVDRERYFGEAPDLTFFDGNNMQRQQDRASCGETMVRPAPVSMLLEIGHALPGVLGPLLASRLSELAAQTAALDAAPAPTAA